jgi:cell division transport system permease protein
MALSVEYVARETAANLWRNRLMTAAAVLTVAVSLSLVGTALVLRQGVANATVLWQHGVNVIVWYRPDASATEEHGIATEVRQLSYVRHCSFHSQEEDFREARRLLEPDVSQVLTPSATPASLRCSLEDPAEAQAVFEQFSGQPGVLRVTYPSQAIRNMQAVTRVLQWAFLLLALVLFLSASVLIVNTIRLAIFARRREVAVMRLVGATNWFIRVPFMCEGLVQGLLGALVAVVAMVGLQGTVDHLAGHGAASSSLLEAMRLTGGELAASALLVVFVGAAIGAAGSAFAVRRFLAT